ncbi:unnamed protein product [Lactuca saligna]|uniref:Protein kinase domain-containing protein n=1 Tax=Lactuca saligna TaxID=75948 RepID=A0AA35Z3E1_LACSI|nr:unnamed protein product [Lactuca saligna]
MDDEKIIVYEYASHGSLDHHLSNTDLTWRQRLKICIAAAKGLCYLHDPNGTEQRVIHCDIKSSNILLDENWNAKVSDMGLSKIGPANQSHSFLPTNVVGTFGYIDPLYIETYSLTKESDVYSFGLVLFEVLCGRLCIEHKNGHFHSLVPMWKKIYEEMKLDEIIFEEVKQHMDPRSLKTFSDDYQCLRISREERPKMSRVVEKLEIALEFQEISEEVELPIDYEEMSKAAVPPLVYRSKEELMMLLYKEKYFSAKEIKIYSEQQYTIMLEIQNTYKREDGLLMAELYHFTSDKRNVDLEITFECQNPLAVEGIEFQPKERVEKHEVLEDEEELYSILRKGFLINNGEEWFSLAKYGKKCHMLSARIMALRKSEWKWCSLPESRFEEVAFDPHGSFWIKCSSNILSPETTYANKVIVRRIYHDPRRNRFHNKGMMVGWK